MQPKHLAVLISSLLEQIQQGLDIKLVAQISSCQFISPKLFPPDSTFAADM